MSEYIEIQGGRPLNGSVRIAGAKNAALPMLMATLLSAEPITFRNVPNLADVSITIHLLEHFGAEVSFHGDTIVTTTPRLKAEEASYSLVKALRASFWVLAPILARGGAARVALPGGDAIGTRPVDIHLDGLAKMGAEIKLKHGVVYATAPHGLRAAEILFPFPSVGATHQLLMAASLTPGRTILRNVAREPEVVALADMLIAMGAKIYGAGGRDIEIEGQSQLGGCEISLIGDRIEAATYLLAGVITGGSVTAQGIKPAHLGGFIEVLNAMGVSVVLGDNLVSVSRNGKILPVQISTAPFPGFATDIQAILMATLALASGTSTIEETIFEGRFGHVPELNRMGARIQVQDRIATIEGVDSLSGAPVEGGDIRGAAALVLAGLAAQGATSIFEHHHLRRGYESLEAKLAGLGASISFKHGEIEDSLAIGC